ALATSGMVTATIDTESMGGGLDPILAVYDKGGRRIIASANSQGSLDTSVTFAAACLTDDDQAGAFLMVMGSKQRFPNDPNVPNPEVIHLEEHTIGDGPGTTGAYSLEISVVNQCGDEPDDTMSLATDTGIVGTGAYVCGGSLIGNGVLCDDPASDVDMWLVEVETAPATLGVRIPCSYGSPPPGIRVFDALGMEIAASVPQPNPDALLGFEIELGVAGTYFVGAAFEGNSNYDPSKECSSTNTSSPIPYDIIITVEQTLVDNTGSIPGGSDAPVGRGKVSELFATRLSDAANTIDVLDPMTGDVTASFPAPEPIFSGAEAITSDGESLYYMGIGRYPNLYRMNPSTGDVLSEYILWSGSGFYSDAAVMGDELFVTDYMDRAVHVFDLTEETNARTLDLGLANGITIGGGLAAMAAPPRLYVADAFNTGVIFEVHPQTGAIVAALPAPPLRPTALGAIANELLFVSDWQGSTVEVLDRAGQGVGTLTLDGPVGSLGAAVTVDFLGDFDADGDIDLRDIAAFGRCFTGLGEPLGPGCAPGDFDENGSVDALDVAAFGAGLTGP
ncbi:MAG: hypothetical protein IID36_10690, partial [Planctomycetes bacterium]|nr:hypothetical protein [Planctomycetota bacterium]